MALHRRIGPAPAALLALAALPCLSAAQTIEGRVTDRESDRPVADAIVRLVEAGGETRIVTAADSVGGFRLAAPSPGSYRVRVQGLGYEAFESRLVDARDPDAVYFVDAPLRRAPVPIEGVEVSVDRMNTRLRQFLGMSPNNLRVRPIRSDRIRSAAERGYDLSEMLQSTTIPNMQVLRSREGPCYQFRGRGCLSIYLDGARLTRSSVPDLPLQMLSTVVVVLPNELIAYPAGAVLLFSEGFMR